MRLLLTTDSVGGVWTYTVSLARGLRAAQCDIRIAVLGPDPDPEMRAEVADLDIVVTGLPLDWTAPDPSGVARAATRIGEIASEWRATSLHLHAPSFAAATLPVQTVAFAHSCVGTWWCAVRGGALPTDLAWRAEMTRAGLLAADLVLAPSHAFATELAQTYGLAETPAVVTHGVAGPTAPPGPPLDASVTIGRLWDDGKDVATLDRAASFLDHPVLAIGGTRGPNGEHRHFTHLRAQGVMPPRDIAALLARRPVFVSTSIYEPFGLAVLEAAQAGCALVLSDIPTFRELWDGVASFVPARDAAGFAAALEALHAAPARRRQAGEAARARAGRFTHDRMVRETHAHHRAIDAARRSRAA